MTTWRDPWLPELLERRAGRLWMESCALDDLIAAHGTPLFCYSRAHLQMRYRALAAAVAELDATIAYAVKANDNLGILAEVARLGGGFDIVSGGELARVLKAVGHADNVVFSGVGKQRRELASALAAGVRVINVESAAEASLVADVARAEGVRAPVAVRVKPEVDADTHPGIATGGADAKFGVPIAEADVLARRLDADPHVDFAGLAFHIGSQLLDLAPIEAALARVLALVDRLAASGVAVRQLDVGGGLGIAYRAGQRPPDPKAYGRMLQRQLGDRSLRLVLEPGRFLVGNAGVLATTVLYLKQVGDKRLLVVDAAMTELLRPSLYDAYHEIVPVEAAAGAPLAQSFVGPVCESSDVLGRDRCLPPLDSGDAVVLLSAGAYGSTMASNYNTRPRPAEVLVDGAHAHLLRVRESIDEVVARDRIPAGVLS